MEHERHYILVAGAWLGSWAWEHVAPILVAAGHDVTPLTLAGLAERSDSADVGLADHVDDILDILETEANPGRVVLVGHSYSGIPVGQAASWFHRDLARVVYIDANVAHEGKSFIDSWSEAGRSLVLGEIADNDGHWPPPPASEFIGQDLTDAVIARLLDRLAPHPGKSLTDPARLKRPLSEVDTTYVKCLMDGPEPSRDVQELLESPTWDLAELDTGHWPMLSQPDMLADLLLSLGRGDPPNQAK
jgi:pimeloyl-ACP methyl ester carboxylesterase